MMDLAHAACPAAKRKPRQQELHALGISTGRQAQMRRDLLLLGISAVLSATMAGAEPALAQKPGGILKIGQFDSPFKYVDP